MMKILIQLWHKCHAKLGCWIVCCDNPRVLRTLWLSQQTIRHPRFLWHLWKNYPRWPKGHLRQFFGLIIRGPADLGLLVQSCMQILIRMGYLYKCPLHTVVLSVARKIVETAMMHQSNFTRILWSPFVQKK